MSATQFLHFNTILCSFPLNFDADLIEAYQTKTIAPGIMHSLSNILSLSQLHLGSILCIAVYFLYLFAALCIFSHFDADLIDAHQTETVAPGLCNTHS